VPRYVKKNFNKGNGDEMENSTSRFSLEVDALAASCPVGEKWAKEKMSRKAIPVLACEGPCIRGEIARLAANMVAKEEPYARSCYAEVVTMPRSSMAQWAKQAEKVVMIDGCHLNCMGRVLNNVVDKDKIEQFDALRIHKKYSNFFETDDVPEAERKETAREVADKILVKLKDEKALTKEQTTFVF
jgi:uncharacterized metal-binding protein